MPGRPLVVLCLAALLAIPSCNPFRRQRQPKVPPPVAPAPEPVKPSAEARPSPVIYDFPDPPELAATPIEAIPPPPVAPEWRLPPPPRSRPRRELTVKVEREPQPEAPRRVPIPRLTQLLTPEEERKLNQEIDESLARARRYLALVSRRALTSDQEIALERVHAFLQQTVEMRPLDLVAARSLAERAHLLAQDLERSTR
jgi:hypothetical protein